MQSALRILYPTQCVSCDALVEGDTGLCGKCWSDTPFITGAVCGGCGAPLIGDVDPEETAYCEACHASPRPWLHGRAATLYSGNARRLVLALKHDDQTDLVPALSQWMARAAAPLLQPDTIIAPIPLHWSRMLKRRYNQSALLALGLRPYVNAIVLPDLLRRTKPTTSLEGLSRDERFDLLRGAITIKPKYADEIQGKRVLIVDDVMTTGATLTAATEALQTSRAREVCVLTLARVTKDA
ncbi:MAG: ComF family protein [Paracoccaceae bacterium]|nr:ComF family protein [Paracoccaceae bacterium]